MSFPSSPIDLKSNEVLDKKIDELIFEVIKSVHDMPNPQNSLSFLLNNVNMMTLQVISEIAEKTVKLEMEYADKMGLK